MGAIPKFRAWHKEHKRMFSVSSIQWDSETQDKLEYVCFYEIGCENKVDQLELMQWTGLKDKDGVAIYEGDLLALDAGQPVYLQEVFFARAAFMVSLDRRVESVWWYLNDCMIKHPVQVVGNIYEDPHMQTGKQEEQTSA